MLGVSSSGLRVTIYRKRNAPLTTQWFPSADGAAPLQPQAGARSKGRQTLICFSHLRWNFVFQRPQHLMTRFAKGRKVIFWEEPILKADLHAAALETRICAGSGVIVVTPQLPERMTGGTASGSCAASSTRCSTASRAT
jgi:hypothetical protein